MNEDTDYHLYGSGPCMQCHVPLHRTAARLVCNSDCGLDVALQDALQHTQPSVTLHFCQQVLVYELCVDLSARVSAVSEGCSVY